MQHTEYFCNGFKLVTLKNVMSVLKNNCNHEYDGLCD
jgi:hypothetical protein